MTTETTHAQTNHTPHAPHTPVIVLKLGSSVIPTQAALGDAAAEVRRWRGRGFHVVAVVSAIGDTTDRLTSRARLVAAQPDASSLAALLATGEAETAALLALALNGAGIGANTLDPGAIGLATSGPALDASATELNAAAIFRALEHRPVLVVPGFIGRDALGRATCLGRGGSDLSALFIARVLNADCRLLKDVDGLYDRDPAGDGGDAASARRFRDVTWDDVLALDEGIVQHKGVRFARAHGQSFTVAGLGGDRGTLVGPGPTAFDSLVEEPCGQEAAA